MRLNAHGCFYLSLIAHFTSSLRLELQIPISRNFKIPKLTVFQKFKLKIALSGGLIISGVVPYHYAMSVAPLDFRYLINL